MRSDAQTRNFLLHECSLDELMAQAAAVRDQAYGGMLTYSPKVFLPITRLCRDTCSYCTFAKTPREDPRLFMTKEEAVRVAREGAKVGCREALFTLGDRPEARYRAAREWLEEAGFDSTLSYVSHVAQAVRDETGLLPHINGGCMDAEEIAKLRPVSASMGLMLESVSERLCERGGPHFGSPDKRPAARLATIAEAGRQGVPFTTGILIGIGETRAERIDALLAIRDLHAAYGHIQEIIVQNFVPKPGTRMAETEAPAHQELLWTLAVARVLFDPAISIQVPPNLNRARLREIIGAGVNDWGGISPLTPDYVNPESPWPELESLRDVCRHSGKTLAARLTIYPSFALEPDRWLDKAMQQPVRDSSDADALAREDGWRAGISQDATLASFASYRKPAKNNPVIELIDEIVANGSEGIATARLSTLFEARDLAFCYLCEAADDMRFRKNGNVATFVVNRNINYTNICTFACSFCAFSKGSRRHAGGERPYLLDLDAIGQRVGEARARGASEVCLQGGIHPSFSGETYLSILQAVKRAVPDMHVHAYSPLEIMHGATTSGMSLDGYLGKLRSEGLGSLPGTAAEILHDPVRRILCPDKLDSQQWLDIIETAHRVGLRTTSTIMFGHVDGYEDWAVHLCLLRDLQKRTGGFTEFVPLPFVAAEAPIYRKGLARPGPTLREAVLMHAVARLVLHPYFENVQASWVKLGAHGMRMALRSGANDMGGVLMNESITRAAGATHGQEMAVSDMREMAHSLGRRLVERTTLYELPQTAAPLLTGRDLDCRRMATVA